MNKNAFMEISRKTLNTSQHTGNLLVGTGAHYSVQLLEKARADTDTVLKELGSQLSGVSDAEADCCLKQVGTNEIAREMGCDEPAVLPTRGTTPVVPSPRSRPDLFGTSSGWRARWPCGAGLVTESVWEGQPGLPKTKKGYRKIVLTTT